MTKTEIMLNGMEEKIDRQSESINELCELCKSLADTQKSISKRVGQLEKKMRITQIEVDEIKQTLVKLDEEIGNVSEASRLLLVTSVLGEAE
jgi:septal ring factor EnvC (AmiA/AmiB activator)